MRLVPWRWLALLCVLAACSIERDYALLSFFFDGVPDPRAPHAEAPAFGPAPRSGPLSLAEREAHQRQRLPQSQLTFHAPFRDKQCGLCHEVRKSGAWLQGVPDLAVPVESLCAKCHEAPATAFVHGPVEMRSCQLCHAHHSSPNPHLVTTARVVDLCRRCHDTSTFATADAHKEYGDRSCTECHDPHAGERQYLLREPGAAPTPMPKATLPVPPTPARAKDQ